MTAPAFAELVAKLVEAMGLQLDAIRAIPEGLLVRTSDGFVFAFLPDPTEVSLASIQRLFAEVDTHPVKLVVLTPTRLPLALSTEVLGRKGTLVEDGRFHELARGLGLGGYLGEEPRPEMPSTGGRLLPSAQQLDQIMHRGRTWLDWGVPALALRFYRQAAALKPGFAPAKVGIGRSLVGLGLTEDADRTFDEVLSAHPSDVDARLGKAAVRAAAGDVAGEVGIYRAILAAEPARVEVRTHLLAALLAQKRWADADKELGVLLKDAPEDPQLRFLRSVTLRHTDSGAQADSERDRARRLGLTPEQERSLCEHLGLPPPEIPEPPAMASETPEVPHAPPRAKPRSTRPAGRGGARPVAKGVRRSRKAKKVPAR